MNIRDISKPVTAKSLNENLEKRFGKKIKLENFSLDELYNARNKLRTSLSQIETNESFDTVNTSETYQKNRLFLDVLIAEINERENIQLEEKESKKRKKVSKTKKAVDEASMDIGMDMEAGNEMDRVPPEDHNDLDFEGGMALKQLSTIDDAADELKDCLDPNENLPEWVQKKIILAMSYIDTARDYMKSAKAVDQERKLETESIIREGAEDQAEIVMAAKNMVDKVTSWMEDTAEMQTESMLELADFIRDELGENESEQFTSTVKPALESLYNSLEETRSSLVSGVRLVAGEEVAPMPGTDEQDLDSDLDMEPTVDQDDSAAELPDDDDFGADDAAAGGTDEAGRAKRESVEQVRRLSNILVSKKK
jgi:hypothetical protein